MNQPNAEIHLVGGRKGGVGKTFLSKHLSEYFTTKQLDFALIEADATIGDVGGVYGGFEKGASTEAVTLQLSDDPKRFSDPDIILRLVAEKPRVLVNLPAETNDALARWMRQSGLIDLCQSHSIGLYHWFVTDGCYASIRLLAESLKQQDGKLPHIVIRNEGRLNGADFTYLNEDPLYQEILAAPNLVCVRDLPVLGSAEQYYLDRNNLTYQEGWQRVEAELGWNGKLPAQRIKTFATDTITLLDRIFVQDIPAFVKPSKVAGAASTESRK